MFDYWMYSLIYFIFAIITYIILKSDKLTGEFFLGILLPSISKKRHPKVYNTLIYFRTFAIIALIIIGVYYLIIDAPDPIRIKPDLTSDEFREVLIGTWDGSSMLVEGNITIIFYSNGTCDGYYNNTGYEGNWRDTTAEEGYNRAELLWDEPFLLPFNDPMFSPSNFTLNYVDYHKGSLFTGFALSLYKLK